MKKYNFDSSINRKESCSIRWNVNEGELPLDIADMDFMVMPEIEKAVKTRAEQACYGYTFVPDSYYQAYIRWWRDRHNTKLEKDWFIFSKSVVASIDSIFKAIGVVIFSKFNSIILIHVSSNVCGETIVNELGKDNKCNELQPLNTWSPIDNNPSFRIIFVSFSQPQNA